MTTADNIASNPSAKSPSGGCPTCGNIDGVGRIHAYLWGYCNQHKKKWLVPGADWDVELLMEEEHLDPFEKVEPLQYQPKSCDVCGEEEWCHHPLCKHGVFASAPMSEETRKQFIAWMREENLLIQERDFLF